MPEEPPNHPTDDELRALSLGQFAEPELASLSAHLADCAACCRRIDELGAADPLLARLRQSATHRDEVLVSPAGRRSAVRALRQGSDGGASHSAADAKAAPVVLPLPSQVGEYDILGEVGRGGMGVVYKARHRTLHRLAALKMVLAGEFASSTQQLRFRLEAELAARVPHPNIVQLYEIGTHEGRPFLALEWVEGGSLADRLGGKPWPPGEAAALVETLARAIHVAHGEGVVHRDLKPANILLSADGTPKIADFGLAQPTDGAPALTQSGYLVGTPGHMAPEQASGRRALVGPATDIHALGVVLYQLLTGQSPFAGDSALDVLRAVMSDEPVRPRRLRPRLPRDLETVCLKCLRKEPGRRYADAQELAEDLGRFRAGEPIVARRVGWPQRLALWVRRRPTQAVACGLAVLALVLAGLGGGAAALWRRTEGALGREQRAKEDAERARAAERKAKDDLDRVLDRHRVLFAHAVWRDNAVGRAEQLLLECAPERRDWEWRYVYRLCHTELITLRGHTSHVTSAAYSPDGRRLLTVGWDGTARLWDAATGRELLTLRTSGGTGEPMTAAAFSPDGRRLATGSNAGVVKVWDAATGQEVLTPNGHRTWVSAAAFSPDGKLLATASTDATVNVWDAAGGAEVRAITTNFGEIHDLAFSPDGGRLATAHENDTARVWDAATGKEVLALRGQADNVMAVRFSPDGTRVAAASNDGTALVWDAATGQEVCALRALAGMVSGVCFSPDGKRLATAHQNGTAHVWDAATGKGILTIRGHTRFVRSVCFSPDGKRLATASNDTTAKVWDATAGQECFALNAHSGRVNGLAFSPDSARLATASHDGTVKVWGAATGREVRTLRGSAAIVFGVCFSPDGSRLATASHDATAKVWDAATGKELLTLRGHAGPVTAVAFSPDGSRLATASHDATAKVWDAATGKELLTLRGHTDEVWSVRFSPDGGRVATASHDGTAKVWDAATGEIVRTFQGPVADRLKCVAFSPDGRRLAVACLYEGTAKVWDVDRGEEVFTLKGHSFHVNAVAFSADGKRLATASADGTAKVWDATTGQEALTLNSHSRGLTSVEFSADGRYLATGDLGGAVQIWDAPHVAPPEAPPAGRPE